jgi:hypothetical protein
MIKAAPMADSKMMWRLRPMRDFSSSSNKGALNKLLAWVASMERLFPLFCLHHLASEK